MAIIFDWIFVSTEQPTEFVVLKVELTFHATPPTTLSFFTTVLNSLF